MVRRCFFAVLICAALVAAACGRAAQQIESDPALDAQGILSRALNQGKSEQLISDHDQTVKMNTVLKTSMEGATVTLNMRLDSKRSGEQRMSEVGAEIKVSAEAGRNNSAKFYVLFQQEENEYHAYARLEKGATSSKRGQEVLSEEGMQDVLGQVQESSMASVEMYAENPEKIAAKEDNGTYWRGVEVSLRLRLILARISSGVLVQMNGCFRLFQLLMNSRILPINSRTETKVPRRMAWRSMMPNQTSTRFNHDPDVGVKWTLMRGFAVSQLRTSTRLCAA